MSNDGSAVEPRPQPVTDAAKLGGLVQAVLVSIGGVVFVVIRGVTEDNLLTLGTAVGAAVTAVTALVLYVVNLRLGRMAAAQVTPLSSPRDDRGIPLVPADTVGEHHVEGETMRKGFRVGDAYVEITTRSPDEAGGA